MTKYWEQKNVSAVMTLVVLAVAIIAGVFLGKEYFRQRDEFGCQSNLRQIGQALRMYAQDNDDRLPPLSSWWEENRLSGKKFAGCPSVQFLPRFKERPDVRRSISAIAGYSYNALLDETENADGSFVTVQNSIIRFPASTIMICEQSADTTAALHVQSKNGNGATRHNGGANYLFCDGHVKWFLPVKIENYSEPMAGRPPAVNRGNRPSFLL